MGIAKRPRSSLAEVLCHNVDGDACTIVCIGM